MTMLDKKCDVCGRDGAVGVAATVLPYSCAYCVPCLEENAQPDIVFESMWNDFGIEFHMINPSYLELVTWKDDKYIDYETWALAKYEEEIDTIH